MIEGQDRSAPALIGDLVGNMTELVRKEVQLLRAEMNEKLTDVIAGAGMILAAMVLVIVALNVLAAALVAALTNFGFNAGWAALIVGVIFAGVAWMLATKGISNLKASNLTPERTAHAVSKDAAMAKEKV